MKVYRRCYNKELKIFEPKKLTKKKFIYIIYLIFASQIYKKNSKKEIYLQVFFIKN